MKLLSPVTYRSEPPSAGVAHTMLDMVNASPTYLTLSTQLRIALLKRTQDVLLDMQERSNLVEEYMQVKKRYQEYPFSYACFERLITEKINNSFMQNYWKYTLQRGENQENPLIRTFTNPDQLREFLFGLPGIDEIYNESFDMLVQTTHSVSVQFIFETKRDPQNNTVTYAYHLFLLFDRGTQYKNPIVQLMLADTVTDLQSLYTLYMHFLPEGVSISESLYRIKNNQLLQQEAFEQRAHDDEQNAYAQLYDPELGYLLNAYRDASLDQSSKEVLLNRLCANEGWCLFIRQTQTMFTYSTLESIIKNRPMDTFRLFTPSRDNDGAMVTFEGQQRSNEMKEMIVELNQFLQNKIIRRKVNKLPYNTFCLVIAGEMIDDETVKITITFGGTALKINNNYESTNQILSIPDFYEFLHAIGCYELNWDDTIHPFYLGYEDDQDKKRFDEEEDDDFDEYLY